jgi:hypothetical protein
MQPNRRLICLELSAHLMNAFRSNKRLLDTLMDEAGHFQNSFQNPHHGQRMRMRGKCFVHSTGPKRLQSCRIFSIIRIAPLKVDLRGERFSKSDEIFTDPQQDHPAIPRGAKDDNLHLTALCTNMVIVSSISHNVCPIVSKICC